MQGNNNPQVIRRIGNMIANDRLLSTAPANNTVGAFFVVVLNVGMCYIILQIYLHN